ncbi:MAG: lamin tail domain-containing protein [bacterium]|nr:lamin tail domain-containing protein [bacterium]
MRTQNLLKVVALAALLFPFVTFAQVVINEVMYNPDGSDTGREWIELYNAGAADVTMVAGSGNGSWRVSDSSNHTLADPAGGVGRGSLTIPAAGYLIVASDPAQFISGGYAGGLYSVIKSSISLNNNSATTSLIDGSGTLLNSFMYTNDMGGNGDGTSLQKNGNTWIAALPTPGATNATTAYTPPSNDTNSNTDTNTTTNTTTTTNTPAPTSSYVAPPEPQIFADAGNDRTVIVAADTEYLGRAYNRKKETVTGQIRFLWNFGDGSIAEGQSVLHHFEYPGRYAVVLNIVENRDAASDKIIVTAEPAKLALAALPDGSVTIGNNAGRDLDLSRWIVRSLGRFFVMPQDSIILAGESLRIGEKTLGFRSSPETELDYPNGAVALQAGTASESSGTQELQTPVVVLASVTSLASPVEISKDEAVVANETVVSKVESEVLADSSPAQEVFGDEPTTTAQVAAAAGASAGPYVWWFGILGLAVAGGGALVAARHVRRREWDIIEESVE